MQWERLMILCNGNWKEWKLGNIQRPRGNREEFVKKQTWNENWNSAQIIQNRFELFKQLFKYELCNYHWRKIWWNGPKNTRMDQTMKPCVTLCFLLCPFLFYTLLFSILIISCPQSACVSIILPLPVHNTITRNSKCGSLLVALLLQMVQNFQSKVWSSKAFFLSKRLYNEYIKHSGGKV